MRSSRRGRAAVVAAVVLCLVAGAYAVAGWGDPPDDKRGAAPIPEGSEVPPPDEPAEQSGTLPAVAPTAAPGFACARGNKPFENPRARYRLCYPEGWGFTDFEQPDPLEQIPARTSQTLRLLSADAFPWTPGRLPFDVIAARGIIDVELNVVPADARARSDCEPSQRRESAGIAIMSCRQSYDEMGEPAPAGPITAVKYLVPLAEPAGDARGSKLLVVVRTSTIRAQEEVDLGWGLVRTIRPY